MNYFDVANSRLLYVLVGIGLLYISGLVVVFMRKAWRRALELGIPKKTILEVVKSSAVFTVIPSISVIIGLFSLSAVLGVPWSWFRLSVVGAVSYELTAAEMVSDALGYQSAGAMAAANNYQVFGAIMFVTSICILAGMITNIFCAKRIQVSMTRYRKSKGAWGAVFNFSFAAALVAAFIPYIILGGSVGIVVLIVSACVSAVMFYIVGKYKIQWLGSFIMSAALIMGMIAAVMATNILG